MSQRRVLSSLLLGAFAVLALAGCPNPPPEQEDAGPVQPNGDGGADAGPPTGACPSCPGGRCGADGGCGPCLNSGECSGATPACETLSGSCVACVPGAADSCPAGQACTPQFTCERGCKTGAGCASGTCLGSRDCSDCESDNECAAGNVCGTGRCGAPCVNPNTCPGGMTCCSGVCVDTARDLGHCGACGTACTSQQFCSGTACKTVSFVNVCENPRATVLLDGLVFDDDAGTYLASNLGTGCSPAPAVMVGPQGDAGVLRLPSGKPLTRGGDLLVAPGGSFGQKLVEYLETTQATPAYYTTDAVTVTFKARDGGTLLQVANSSITAGHDYFLVQLVREPQRGALSLVIDGFDGPGTTAAAWYFVNQVLPNRASRPERWYLVEWTDTNANTQPDSADTFAVLHSGS